jgi:hypothetical protein
MSPKLIWQLREKQTRELRMIQQTATHYERAAEATLVNQPTNWQLLVGECRDRAHEARVLVRWHTKRYPLSNM